MHLFQQSCDVENTSVRAQALINEVNTAEQKYRQNKHKTS